MNRRFSAQLNGGTLKMVNDLIEDVIENLIFHYWKRVDEQIPTILKEFGWSYVSRYMSKITDYLYPVHDGLMRFIGFDRFGWLDIGFPPFTVIEAHDISELQEKAIPILQGILMQQVMQKHTYFLDVSRIRESRFQAVVEEMCKKRDDEYEFALTADGKAAFDCQYGYQSMIDHETVDEKYRELYDRLTDIIRRNQTPKELNMLLTDKLFPRCSKPTARLLSMGLRLHHGNERMRKDATTQLADMGERGIEFLKGRLSIEENQEIRDSIESNLTWFLREKVTE